MRAAKLGVILLASAAAALAIVVGQDKPPVTQSAEVRPKSFVCMDLLFRAAKELVPPKRSIFSPSAEDEGEDVASIPAGPGKIPASGAPGRANPGTRSGKTPANANEALPSLSLRYIGFVQSPKSIIGLALVQGQALAVQTGDIVADWYKVGSITPKSIELTGPDGVKMTFPLEGDEE